MIGIPTKQTLKIESVNGMLPLAMYANEPSWGEEPNARRERRVIT